MAQDLSAASTLPAVTVGGNGVVGGVGTPALQVNNSELYLDVPSGVNTNPTNITTVVNGNTLYLPGRMIIWAGRCKRTRWTWPTP